MSAGGTPHINLGHLMAWVTRSNKAFNIRSSPTFNDINDLSHLIIIIEHEYSKPFVICGRESRVLQPFIYRVLQPLYESDNPMTDFLHEKID